MAKKYLKYVSKDKHNTTQPKPYFKESKYVQIYQMLPLFLCLNSVKCHDFDWPFGEKVV